MSLALIITTFNRSELLAQCLDSLSKADLSGVADIYVHDDASTDIGVVGIITQFFLDVKPFVHFYRPPKNVGIKSALLRCYDNAFMQGADLCCNLDADVIVKPDFIQTLLTLREQHPKNIISGFNCDNKQNPIIDELPGAVTRKHCNGINMLMDKQQYERVIKPALTKSGNWDYNSTHELPFIIAKPSVIQHIGANNSSMGHTNGDVACDFKLLSLPNVSLFGIDAHDPAGIRRAADICTRDVEFAGSLIITSHDYFRGREGYSKFMIRDLWEHVKDLPGTHVLTIHEDGYVQRPEAWMDEFLQYDYIGARWLYHSHAVGNGGFSLRSKRFIEACSKLDITDFHPEDDKLCRKYRPYLEEQGLKFAPVDIADRFSIEAYGCNVMTDSEGINAATYCGSFGFHGHHVKGLPNPPKGKNIPVVINRKPSVQNGRLKQTRFR